MGNLIVGGPGMRIYSGRKNAIDIALLGAYDCKYPIFRTGLDSTFQFYDPSPFIRQPKLEFQGY
ncbi:MAG: hypothetical protein RL525_526 [Bacteroidota bacterium]